MVRVVSEKPVKTKKLICGKCGYELEYTGEDIKEGSSSDYTGDRDYYKYILCPRPTCNHENRVSSY